MPDPGGRPAEAERIFACASGRKGEKPGEAVSLRPAFCVGIKPCFEARFDKGLFDSAQANACLSLRTGSGDEPSESPFGTCQFCRFFPQKQRGFLGRAPKSGSEAKKALTMPFYRGKVRPIKSRNGKNTRFCPSASRNRVRVRRQRLRGSASGRCPSEGQ